MFGFDGLPESLIRTESGGNFGARNNVAGAGGVGHFGRGQFSHARLTDAMNAGVIPRGTTPDQFLANPGMQEAVERWHVSDIGRRIQEAGLDRFVGQTINGTQVTPEGMLAVAHLGGFGGLRRFLESGGQYNPADAFGTSLQNYLGTHGGGRSGGMGQNALAGQMTPQMRPDDRRAQMNALASMMPRYETPEINAFRIERV